ncbi:MAG: DUF503 domain-containing protein [bacterium]
MLVGTMTVELYLPGTGSLKEKRFVLKSLKTKIRNRFNVSIAEIDHHDKWQRSSFGIAAVATDRRFLDETLSKVMNAVSQESRVEVIDQMIEIL